MKADLSPSTATARLSNFEDVPPSYAPIDRAAADLSSLFSNLNLDSSGKVPSPDQCIVHLKLLESFSLLREDVGLTDGLYGLFDSFVPEKGPDEDRNKIQIRVRERRWAIYVMSAARRFETWYQTLESNSQMVTMDSMQSPEYESIGKTGRRVEFTKDTLPPLDVLMVWHAATLNPRNWMSDCIRHGKMGLWQTGIPWPVINSVIDNTCDYQPSTTARQVFESQTGHPWDNLKEPPGVSLSCPRCKAKVTAPWTSCVEKNQWLDPKVAETGVGFADAGFEARCTCGLTIHHDLLRTQRFRKDLQALLVHQVPMPGTLLSLNGLTPPVNFTRYVMDTKSNSTARMQYPNRLMLAGGAVELTNDTELSKTPQYTGFDYTTHITSIDDVRKKIEKVLKDPHILKRASATGKYAVSYKEERIAIRKMMACYWDNSSIFSMDLASAVIRQGSFVDKMHDIDWLHSPAVVSTMKRLIQKYERYINIIATNPNNVAVPTLDVDLAWHTHQTSSRSYFDYTRSKTGKFIDHDDKIEENKLSASFEWTSKTYEKMYGELYSECTCWYCESIRESHTSSISRVFKSSKSDIAQELQRLHANGPSDPHKSAHISAHNSIPGENVRDYKTRSYVKEKQIERGYEKACRRAKKEGREPPKRDDDYYLWAWGYPMYMPFYAPYMAYPVTPGFYPCNPACGNFGTGAIGNCCAGACGGGVAFGSCSAGACGGGAAGGCSAGVGGSGGCAGGGGGGCGGGGGGCGGGGGGC
ncbi:MAG: hypothetical protein MMC23_005560 [Stictis urceolatum]|nr:hypothetical protein [Stictis urceolata]